MDLFGPLPPTFRSYNRDDGLRGIYPYRMPAACPLPSVLRASLTRYGPPGHVELIHFGLRYAMA